MATEVEGGLIARFRSARHSAHRYRHTADMRTKVTLAIGMAALTGVLAQVEIPLPFTPVPITGQTFAVLLAGVALGAKWGGVSQGLYAGGGAAGVPWFKDLGSGVSHLTGATGGYIIGFVLAAIVVGFVLARFPRARRLPHLFVLLLGVNFVVIYALGLPWLWAWGQTTIGPSFGVMQTLELGLLPFIPGDILKVLGVTAVARVILPADPVETD